MNSEQLKNLEKELWGAADTLRADSQLKPNEYYDPVLGLIILRFAQNRFEEAKTEIEKKLPINPRTGQAREITKDDFKGEGALYLREESKYEYLASLPESEDISEAVNNAMRAIESDYSNLAGVLPKNYQELEDDLLRELIRVFNTEAIRSVSGDAFGRIYEYFLMKFAMAGAGGNDDGEFFTPPSLVELIVNFIEPDHGIIHDPACGSGGMFVQSGHFIHSLKNKEINEAVTIYGTEKIESNTKLAKMNLAIHGIEGSIIRSNSFYSNPHELTGKCDFVMANPPFNVKKIDKNKDFVKEDSRLPFGLPKNDNGNYLWIQYFYSYLNENGRAGFVMASSAADAGGSEKLIRQKLIETGDVEAIVSIGTNFFYTRPLPCHLWFFNKNKQEKDSILMIDARNTFRKVNSTVNDFTPDHLEGLTNIMKSYRGEEVDLTTNEWLTKTFKSGCYEDIEGLCKVASMDEIIENNFSLTPGRYVGSSIEIDEDFDYQARISEIHDELAKLNSESDELMKAIQGLKL